MTWLTGWSYRKSHVVQAASGAGTNYQKKITAHYGSSGTWEQFLSCLTNFVRNASNPLMSPTLDWEGTNIGDFVVIEEATELRMYYTGFATTIKNAIGLATSPKTYPPTTWTKQGAVFTPNPASGQWDSGYIRLGNIFKVDSTYYLYYQGAPNIGGGGTSQIGLATSTDGISFTRSASNPILVPSGDEIQLEDPTVIRVDATHWYMYYNWRTSTDTLPGIRVATSSDGVTWTKVSGNVLDRGASGQWDDTYIEHSQIYYIGGKYVLIYEGYGGSGNEPWKHGMAYNTSPTTAFTKYSGNPFFSPSGVVGAFDQYHVATPNLFFHDKWYLFYQGGDNKDNYGLSNWKMGLAEGPPAGDDVYLNSHSKTDFGDVRFTRSDGTTLLDYWMESKVDSDNAVFWVEIPDDLSTTNATIYIYYGNPTATTTSNGTNTFVFFDDFDDPALPSWTFVDNADISKSVTGSKLIWSAGALALLFREEMLYRSIGDNVIAEGKFSIDSATGTAIAVLELLRLSATAQNEADATNWIYVSESADPDDAYKFWFRKEEGGTYTSISTIAAWDTAYHIYGISRIGTTIKSFFDYAYQSINTISFTPLYLIISARCDQTVSGSMQMAFEWVRTRKYVDPEPLNASWGSEETPAFTITGITRDANGTPLGSSTVWLFRTSDKAFIAATTSDASGNYSFTVSDTTTQYFVRAYKDGTPNVFGTTDKNLVGS